MQSALKHVHQAKIACLPVAPLPGSQAQHDPLTARLQLTPQIPTIFKLTPRLQSPTLHIFTLTAHLPRRLQLAFANAP